MPQDLMSYDLTEEAAVPAVNVMSCICRAESRGRLPWEELSPDTNGSCHIPLPWWSKGCAATERHLNDDHSTEGNSIP